LLDQISKSKKQARKVVSQQPQSKNHNNISLLVEQGSFLVPSNMVLQNNSSFFVFDHQKVLNRVNSNVRMNSDEKKLSLEGSLHKKDSNLLMNLNSSREVLRRKTKRSNTEEKMVMNLSP
jgi:hypothetical protein